MGRTKRNLLFIDDDRLSKPFEIGELQLAIEQALRTLVLESVELVQRYKRDKESAKMILIGSNDGLRKCWVWWIWRPQTPLPS